MKYKQLALAIGLAIGNSPAVFADTVEQRLARMETLMTEMQKRLSDQDRTIKRQADTIAEQKERLEGTPERIQRLEESVARKQATAEGGEAWYQNIEIAGVIEYEIGYTSPYQGSSESDNTLATFELGVFAPSPTG